MQGRGALYNENSENIEKGPNIYIGDWENEAACGYGTYQDINTKVTYEGQWYRDAR
jgi:hypothetical protein